MFEIRKAQKKDFKEIQKLNWLLFKKEQKDYDPTLNIDWPFSEEGERYFVESINSKDRIVLVAVSNNKKNKNDKKQKKSKQEMGNSNKKEEKNDGEIAGYLIGVLKDINNSRLVNKRAVLDNMYVKKKYRNKRVGKKMVQEFIQWAKNKKVENIRVTAFAGNERAIKFYRQCGFKDYNHTMEIALN